LHDIIFEAETPAGKAFDVALLIAILVSVAAVMLETVEPIDQQAHELFFGLEWALTGLFTIEYVLRLISVRKPSRYAWSFYGIVDLLAILPTYISLLIPGAQSLLTIRALRLLRTFRVFKLAHLLNEAESLRLAVWASRGKVTVFLATVLIITLIMGSLMYLIEGGRPDTPFTSIPQSVYWAVVTLTTVGYGDISPQTPLGKAISALCMILGYSLIIVPTGILSAELARGPRDRDSIDPRACDACGAEGHDLDAHFCKRCGAEL